MYDQVKGRVGSGRGGVLRKITESRKFIYVVNKMSAGYNLIEGNKMCG